MKILIGIAAFFAGLAITVIYNLLRQTRKYDKKRNKEFD